MKESILKLSNISHGFSSEKNTIDNLSLNINKGEFITILGESGSGKSTLLKIAGQLIIPKRGSVLTTKSNNFIFQNNNLFPWFTVRKNIVLGTSKVQQSEHNDMMQKLKIVQLADRYPDSLSGGENQLVAIARAFICKPDLIFMDEPFGALDDITRQKLQLLLFQYWKQSNSSILFITHDIEEAILLSDKIFILKEGRLLKPVNIPFKNRDSDLRYTAPFVKLRKSLSTMLKLEL